MNTILAKFYSDGKSLNKPLGQLGTNPVLLQTTNPLNYTSMSQVINPSTHNNHGPLSATQPHPFNQPRPDFTSRNTFQATGKSMFVPSPNNIPKASQYPTKFYKTNQEITMDEKKNASKLQIMEEKMKGLELKSQRLEVINDFFFDMFENNIKGQLKTNQQEINGDIDEEEEEVNEEEEEEDYEDHKRQHKKGKRHKKNKSAKQQYENIKPVEQVKPSFDPQDFQKKTLKNAAKIMKNMKKNVSDYICNTILIY